MNSAERYPAIGIRPAIDGRRKGVRESLENQTLAMAAKVAYFLSENLRYPTGEKVRCVPAPFCIGGVAEAVRCDELFKRENVGLTVTVTPCWCYGTETMDMDPVRPKAVWGFNGTERPGAVYLAAVLAAHAQNGLPAFGIYGEDVQEAGDKEIPPDVKKKLLGFARAGLAFCLPAGKSYLSMGSVSMGIAGSCVDEHFFREYLGMRNEYVDMSEFTRRIAEGIFDPQEYKKALAWTLANCREGKDYNTAAISSAAREKTWETVVKMSLIARDLMVGNPVLEGLGYGEESLGHNAILAGFQGQRHWTDHSPNGDFMEAILNSSFDWNGRRKPYLLATENDSLNGVAMLFGHLLTNTAQMFSDVRTYWSPAAVKRVTGHSLAGAAEAGVIHLINSGASALDFCGAQMVSNDSHLSLASGYWSGAARTEANNQKQETSNQQPATSSHPAVKPFWEISDSEVNACLKACTWPPAIYEYFRGGGFSSCFLTKGGMPVTMSRVNLVRGLGPVLQLAEGFTVDLPAEVNAMLTERTNPTWPTTWFAPRLTGKGPFADVYSVMNNWGANHGAISYGHIGADLITLASMFRIPVCMHNVAEKDIFRPSAWNAFGMDKEGQDYRACASFGPLYR
jgi:L-fucose isomerase